MSKTEKVIFIILTIILIAVSFFCYRWIASEHTPWDGTITGEIIKNASAIILLPSWILFLIGLPLFVVPIIGAPLNGILDALIIMGLWRLIKKLRRK